MVMIVTASKQTAVDKAPTIARQPSDQQSAAISTAASCGLNSSSPAIAPAARPRCVRQQATAAHTRNSERHVFCSLEITCRNGKEQTSSSGINPQVRQPAFAGKILASSATAPVV